jgi:hypothetical protein
MALISRKERKEADELRKWAEDTGAKPADFAPTTKGQCAAAACRATTRRVAVAVATSKPLSGTFSPHSGTFKPLPMVAQRHVQAAAGGQWHVQAAAGGAGVAACTAAARLPGHTPQHDNVAAADSVVQRQRRRARARGVDARSVQGGRADSGHWDARCRSCRRPRAAPCRRHPAAPVAPVRETATALYDFEGTQPGDLSLTEGDTIKLIDTSLSWWKGEVNGVIGSFPNNYAQKNYI